LHEAFSVESDEADLSPNPEITLVGLKNRIDGAMGKAFFITPATDQEFGF